MFVQSVIKNPSRSFRNITKGASTVFAKGAVVAKAASGLCTPGTSATVRSEVLGISNLAIAALDALTEVPAIEIFENDLFVVDTTNNSNEAHNGQRMVLTDSVTVNNTGTDDADGIVEQVEAYGDPSDKKILVRFV